MNSDDASDTHFEQIRREERRGEVERAECEMKIPTQISADRLLEPSSGSGSGNDCEPIE